MIFCAPCDTLFSEAMEVDDEDSKKKKCVLCAVFFVRFLKNTSSVCRVVCSLYFLDISYKDLWRLLHVIDIFIEDNNH